LNSSTDIGKGEERVNVIGGEKGIFFIIIKIQKGGRGT